MKRNVIALSLLILPVAASIYLGISNFSLKQALYRLERNREQDFKKLLMRQRQSIIKDVEEKYKADMVSFEALSKRMEIERKKTTQLEEDLKRLKESKK